MQFLKQSTAAILKIGPFSDDTDGNTAETGLTITQAEVRLSKNGANIAQKNDATSCTHDELGLYNCPLNTTDTATLGRLQVYVHESGALPVWHEYMVLTAEAYDTLCSTDHWTVDLNGVQAVNATQISGDATAADNLELDYDGTGYTKTNSTIGTCTTNTDMVSAAPTVVEIRTEMDNNSNDLNSILEDTNELQGNQANWTTAVGFATPAEVNTQVVDVLKTDTTSEPSQGAPPATPTFEEMVAYIYFKLRNKGETTATEDAMYADDGTTKIMKSTLSDAGGTFTKAEYISGA